MKRERERERERERDRDRDRDRDSQRERERDTERERRRRRMIRPTSPTVLACEEIARHTVSLTRKLAKCAGFARIQE